MADKRFLDSEGRRKRNLHETTFGTFKVMRPKTTPGQVPGVGAVESVESTTAYFDDDGHLIVEGGVDENDMDEGASCSWPLEEAAGHQVSEPCTWQINNDDGCSWQLEDTTGQGSEPSTMRINKRKGYVTNEDETAIFLPEHSESRRCRVKREDDWVPNCFLESSYLSEDYDFDHVPPRIDVELRDEEIPLRGYHGEHVPGADDDYVYTDDFATFRGTREEFLGEGAGPKIEGTSPVDVFTQVFDRPLVEIIVRETNKFAWDTIAQASETEIPSWSRINKWVETTVSEIYRFIAITIIMAICFRSRIDEYWSTDIWDMPKFRKLMTRDRFMLLIRFLNFCDNNEVAMGPDRKIHKIKPIVDYLNAKFKAVYSPRREIAVDESLLWKGQLSWVQSIRTKAARFGIKSYELCESVTGYCLTIVLYSGKDTVSREPLYGFTGATAKTVLTLMADFFDKGHTLFMDNFYTSIPLARYLKSRCTDVVGTMNRRRIGTPADIKVLSESVPRGTVVSRHCGDVSVHSWKDNKLVTMVSTYHNDDMTSGPLGGRNKPCAVHTYNSFMGGVDLKDQKLSAHLLERKRGLRWYIKAFRRLINVSILNSHIIHSSNVGDQRKLSQRAFRCRLVHELLDRFSAQTEPRVIENVRPRTLPPQRLNKELIHTPTTVELARERTKQQNKLKRGTCVRCCMLGVRRVSSVSCDQCKVFLCLNACWRDYHTLPEMCLSGKKMK